MAGPKNRLRVLFPLIFALALTNCQTDRAVQSTARKQFPIPADSLVVESDGKLGGSLHYASSGEPRTFNWLAAQDGRSKLAAMLTTGTLLEFDPVQQKVVPGIAKHWDISEDGLSVALQLRQGLRFSDGRPLEMEDVLFTFRKIYQDDSVNSLKDALLVGGKALHIQATGKHQLRIVFPQRYAAAEYILTTVPVLPRHRFPEPERGIETYWTLNTPPGEMAGLGPFVLHQHQPGKQSTFKSNPHYWKVDREGRRLPYLDEVVLHYIQDRNNRLLRFQAGQVDLLDPPLRAEDFTYLSDREGIQLHDAGASTQLSVLWFNLRGSENPRAAGAGVPLRWFKKPSFRRAVSRSISRRAIVENVYLGQAQEAHTLVPSSIRSWHWPGNQQSQQPEEARRLLKEAGFSWREVAGREQLVDRQGEPVEFEILTRADDLLGKTATLIQQDLADISHISP